MAKHIMRTVEQKMELIRTFDSRGKEVSALDFCRSNGIKNMAQIYQWKKAIAAGPKAEPVREIVHVNGANDKKKIAFLESENVRLRRIVSDLMLDIQALKEYSGRN